LAPLEDVSNSSRHHLERGRGSGIMKLVPSVKTASRGGSSVSETYAEREKKSLSKGRSQAISGSAGKTGEKKKKESWKGLNPCDKQKKGITTVSLQCFGEGKVSRKGALVQGENSKGHRPN